MRKLSARQKTLLRGFIVSQLNPIDSFQRTISVFKEEKHHLDPDDLSDEFYDKIKALNDYETLYQDIDRYLSDECTNIIHAQIYK